MKKKIFMLLALVMTVMAASAKTATYALTVGASDHGTIAFTVNGKSADSAAEGDEVTVTITPDEFYVLDEVKGQWYAAVANARQRAIGLLNKVDLKPAGNNTWTFTMERANVEISATYQKMLNGAEGYYGVYDGDAHGINVTASDGATVKFGETEGVYNLEVSPMYVDAGTYTVYYKVTKGNLDAVTGSAVVYIAKAPATISYATKTVNKTFGDSEFINPLTLTGDGTETYRTSDRDVAIVDAETGEVTITGAGTATITATVVDGTNYTYDPNEASYEITVGNATMEVTSAGWTGVYDGESHSITVNAPEGAKVRYGRAEDSYNLTRIPTYTNSGTYTCYYQVTMANYTPVTGHETVTINKAAGTISYETASVKKAQGDAAFTNPLTNTGDGVVSYSSSDSKVARVNATTGEVTIGKKDGTATITATVKDGPNYDYAEKTATYTVIVGETTEPGGDEPGGDEPGGDDPGEVDVIQINVDANEADGNNDEVDGVKFNVTIDKNAQPRQEERTFTDPETGETVTKTVTIVPITLESIIIPQQEGASAADKQEIVVTVPPYVVGPDGTIYEITSIAADAFVSNEPTAIVTTVVLPDTENPLTFEAGAMNNGGSEAMKVLTPLQHLDDYALDNALAQSYESLKVSAIVTPPNRYWTFSCGVDVLVPEGVSVYTCQVNNQKEVEITPIAEEKLTVEGERIIMANNGVLVACTDGSDDNAYEIVANPGRQKSGSKIVTTDAKSYGTNLLEPVIEKKNYAASDYYVLVENEFHPILFNNSKVSACKAVLKYTGGANARMAITVANGTTGIDASLVNSEERIVNSDGDVYDLNGRQVQKPAKGGVYIINNKKVVIKK